MTEQRSPVPVPPTPSNANAIRIAGALSSLNVYDRSVGVVASTPNVVNGEAITQWDLSRFLKSPIACWDHLDPANGIAGSLPIGKVTDLKFDPAVGLTARIRFAAEKANPLAENIFLLVQDEIIRAVSVQFEYLGNGLARLLELSFVPIGADEDAGTEALNPAAATVANKPDMTVGDDADVDIDAMTDELRAKVRDAASRLAKYGAKLRSHRRRLAATRTDSNEVERTDRGPIDLSRAKDTASGGKQIPATLARTGVLVYRNADGSERRELRLPEEQFREDVLETLDHAPVIDISNHNRMVTSDSWKNAAVGSVGGVQSQEKFIRGTLHVQDKATLDSIARGDRTEVSLGYRCQLEAIPGGVYQGDGPFKGTRADYVQRNLRFNHAALCPPGRGRAGSEVGLRLDSADIQPWAVAHLDEDESEGAAAMAEPNKSIVKIRLDNRDVEEHSKEHFDAVETIHKNAVAKLTSDNASAIDAIQKRLDATSGERDAFKLDLETIRADAAKKQAKGDDDDKNAQESMRRSVKKFMKTMRVLERLFGKPDKDDETKLDACLDGPNPERALQLYALTKVDPKFDAKDPETGKERGDVYIEARFDAMAESAKTRITDAADIVRSEAGRLDANDGTGISKLAADFVAETKKKQEELRTRANGFGNGGK